MRGDDDRIRQLQLFRADATDQRAGPSCSVFKNSGADSTLGRIAFSRRKRLRARAARARLARKSGRVFARSII